MGKHWLFKSPKRSYARRGGPTNFCFVGYARLTFRPTTAMLASRSKNNSSYLSPVRISEYLETSGSSMFISFFTLN